jgi:hypothetical protein
MEKRKNGQIAALYFPINKFGFIYKLVTIEDAEFIVKLRTHPSLSRHLSSTSNSIEDQIEWIRKYKERESQGLEFYILCSDVATNRKLGLNRIYNIFDNEFEIGSWLYEPDQEVSTSILGDIFARSFAFDIFNFTSCVFSVRKENKSVLRYHLSYKPQVINEDEQNLYFRLKRENFELHKNKLLKILGHE